MNAVACLLVHTFAWSRPPESYYMKKYLKSTLFLQKGDVPSKKDPVSTLQYLLGPLPKLIVSGHLLGVQLMSVNAYLHTSIVYGQWEGWDGNPVDEAPLFYHGVSESTAKLTSTVSDEVIDIARAIEKKTGADMSGVS